VPGLQVAHNTATDVGALVMLSDSDGTVARLMVHDNEVRNAGEDGAILLARGVHGVTIERNRLQAGAGAAVLFDDSRGSGSTDDVQLIGNDISGFQWAIRTDGTRGSASIVARGNRMVDVQRSGLAIDSTSPGSDVDARGNWWGRSSGLPAGATRGTVDASAPLRLIGVDAPTAIYVGGSGVVAVRLVSELDTQPAAAAGGFAVTFSSSSATLEASIVAVTRGRASTIITAGTTAGSTTTIATLDAETATATTRVVAAGGGAADDAPAAPGAADSRPPISRYVAKSTFLKRTLRFSLSRGFRQAVSTNQHASVRTTYLISHYDAQRMRLRPRTNYTHRPFVIARVRTRAIRGNRIVTAPVNARPAFAIRRAHRRIAVQVLSVVRTPKGQIRRSSRRLVLPANVL
jgi:hypothetical protein